MNNYYNVYYYYNIVNNINNLQQEFVWKESSEIFLWLFTARFFALQKL